jgi:holliday junction DNA helicase RuvA
MTNADVVRKLREHAGALGRSGANLYRVRAFRQAAVAVMAAERDVESVAAEAGPIGLQREFGLGASVAETIAEYLRSGAWLPHDGGR